MQNHIAVFPITAHSECVKVQGYLNAHFQKAISEEKPLVVRISNKVEDRSHAQNRLYWMWMTQWAKHQGTDKEYEHSFFKKRFLSIIFDRDDVGQYRKTFAAVKELRKEKHPMYEQVASGLTELISTTDASVAQFTEYLNDIHNFCLKHGCYLNAPDDLKYLME